MKRLQRNWVHELITDTDDSIILNIIQHTGPSDITPYVGLVGAMEQALGMAKKG